MIYLITRSDCDSDHSTNDGMVLYSGFAVVRAYHTLDEAKSHLHEAALEDAYGDLEQWEAKPGTLDDDYKIVESTENDSVVLCCDDEVYACFEIRTIDI